MFENWALQASESDSISFQDFDVEGLADDLHRHSSYELVYISAGSGVWQIGGVQGAFGAGTLILCPPRVMHAWWSGSAAKSGSRTSGIVLRFSREVLPGSLLRLPEMESLRELEKKLSAPLEFRVLDQARLRTRLNSVDRSKGVLKIARLLVALDLIASLECKQVVAEEKNKADLGSKDFARIERVKRFIEEHFRQHISRSDAARALGMEEAAFSRFFRRTLGMTYVDYVNNFRVRQAAALLGNRRGMGIEEIARQSGFGSLASLHRQFKKRLGTTPESYRKAANSEFQAP
ncbi:helix-turn-helix domain-containing protein [Pelagicoccus albus]|uniref:Helix-turn-helix transcriptional regulator n=1 Tax=Pelagicoccus albus TaxID=415222 RepID=A0A7X1B505_9BACT|nr:AraC family transcriptional regulator [Pelagicoccus albus]MBC2605642.1 helix-turn-helix transcriptional regulator [Pelagicoccus albus]